MALKYERWDWAEAVEGKFLIVILEISRLSNCPVLLDQLWFARGYCIFFTHWERESSFFLMLFQRQFLHFPLPSCQSFPLSRVFPLESFKTIEKRPETSVLKERTVSGLNLCLCFRWFTWRISFVAIAISLNKAKKKQTTLISTNEVLLLHCTRKNLFEET